MVCQEWASHEIVRSLAGALIGGSTLKITLSSSGIGEHEDGQAAGENTDMRFRSNALPVALAASRTTSLTNHKPLNRTKQFAGALWYIGHEARASW